MLGQQNAYYRPIDAHRPLPTPVVWADSSEKMPPLKYFAEIPGKCETLSVGSARLSGCKNVVFNMAYKSNRVSFFFFSENNRIIVFSGGRDEQPRPDSYRLTLTNVNDTQKQIEATGFCEINGDIMKGARIVCKATPSDPAQPTYEAAFVTEGKPTVHRGD
jgi:hypothetical protein